MVYGQELRGVRRCLFCFLSIALLCVAGLTDFLRAANSDEETVKRIQKEIDDTFKMQDENMAKWPDFDAAKPALLAELEKEHAISQLSDTALAKLAQEYFDRFWEKGYQSTNQFDSWQCAYKALVLAKKLVDKNPMNLALGDLYFEIYQGVWPSYTYEQSKRDPALFSPRAEEIIGFRKAQFEQRRNEILSRKRKPEYADFLCGYDVVVMLMTQASGKVSAEARDVALFLQKISSEMQWTEFLAALTPIIEKNEAIFCNIYGDMSDDIMYNRAFPSFHSPRSRQWYHREEYRAIENAKKK